MSNVLLVLMFLPIISEIVRKYIVFNNNVFFISDSIIILFCIVMFIFKKNQNLKLYVILLSVYCAIGIIPYFINGNSLLLIMVGIRPVIIPLSMLYISYNLFLNYQVNDKLYKIIFFWMCVIGVTALLQIILGKSSFINYSAAQVGSELSGIGDYSYKGVVIGGLFRPTSIFLHTGKFGQIIFLFALAVVCRLACVKKISLLHFIGFVLSFLFVYVSGQRAAMVLLPVAFMLVMGINKKINIQFILYLLLISLGIFFVFPEEYLLFSFKRAFSGVTGIGSRFGGALSSANEIFDSYFLVGEGIGFFTFGSQNYGGEVLFKVFKNAEHGWLKIYAETGFFGLTFYVLFIISVITRSLIFCLKAEFKNNWFAIVAFISIISFSVWSFTHDIFSNYLTMSYVFVFIGAFEGLNSNYKLNKVDEYNGNTAYVY